MSAEDLNKAIDLRVIGELPLLKQNDFNRRCCNWGYSLALRDMSEFITRNNTPTLGKFLDDLIQSLKVVNLVH